LQSTTFIAHWISSSVFFLASLLIFLLLWALEPTLKELQELFPVFSQYVSMSFTGRTKLTVICWLPNELYRSAVIGPTAAVLTDFVELFHDALHSSFSETNTETT